MASKRMATIEEKMGEWGEEMKSIRERMTTIEEKLTGVADIKGGLEEIKALIQQLMATQPGDPNPKSIQKEGGQIPHPSPPKDARQNDDRGSQVKGGQPREEDRCIHDTEVIESNTLLSSEAPRNKRGADGRDQKEEGEPSNRRRTRRHEDDTPSPGHQHHLTNRDFSPSYSTEEIIPTDLMGERITEQGRQEVLIKWKGWPWNCCTWEPAAWIAHHYPAFHLEDKVRFWAAGVDRHRNPSPPQERPQGGIRTYTRRPKQQEAWTEACRLKQGRQTPTNDGYGNGRYEWERPPEQRREKGSARVARIRAAHWENHHGGAFMMGGRTGGLPIKPEPSNAYDRGGGEGGWIWE